MNQDDPIHWNLGEDNIFNKKGIKCHPISSSWPCVFSTLFTPESIENFFNWLGFVQKFIKYLFLVKLRVLKNKMEYKSTPCSLSTTSSPGGNHYYNFHGDLLKTFLWLPKHMALFLFFTINGILYLFMWNITFSLILGIFHAITEPT